MNIIGEQTLTKVYEYFSKPMICRQCPESGHTVKHCKQQIQHVANVMRLATVGMNVLPWT